MNIINFTYITVYHLYGRSLQDDIEMEDKVANKMLTVIVCGIFTHISYPLASFPTRGPRKQFLHKILQQDLV